MYLFLDRKWTCGLQRFYLWHFRSWYDLVALNPIFVNILQQRNKLRGDLLETIIKWCSFSPFIVNEGVRQTQTKKKEQITGSLFSFHISSFIIKNLITIPTVPYKRTWILDPHLFQTCTYAFSYTHALISIVCFDCFIFSFKNKFI